MKVGELVMKFRENPDRMRMGTKKLAERYKASLNDVIIARDIARKQITNSRDNDYKIGRVVAEKEAKQLLDVSNYSMFKDAPSFATLAQKGIASPTPYLRGNKKNVLIIGDTHEPFCKEGYLEFCREMQEKYDCGTVVHIGDTVDNHAISYHESDPSGLSAGTEFNLAKDNMKKWYKTFPEVMVCIGNHDALPFRKIFTAGLPKEWLKTYEQLLEAPNGWKWDFVHHHEGVIYQHGTGMSGEMASVNAARENRQSTVIGHLHTVCNTRFLASYKDLIFGMTVGCGIDHTKYAFAYGREQTRKPVLACAVVLDGSTPINLPMKY